MTEEAPRALGHLVAAWIAVAFTMLVLDLLWLGADFNRFAVIWCRFPSICCIWK